MIPDFFFHYTNRLSSQEIEISGWIRTGRSGKVYFAGAEYVTGAEAANELSIVHDRPVEVNGKLPGIPDAAGPFLVMPIIDRLGGILRRGGGFEWWVGRDVAAMGVTWSTLKVP